MRPCRKFVALTLLSLTLTTAASAEVALFVNGSDVNLRSGPGQESTRVIGSLNLGDEVRIKSQNGQWREVYVPKTRQVGWVAHWLLSEAPPLGMRREVVGVDCDDLIVRDGPGQSNAQVAVLQRGKVLDVIAYEGQWRKVRDPNGSLVGWVAAWLVKPATVAEQSPLPRPDAGGPAESSRWVKAKFLYLRTGPGPDNQALAILAEGTHVDLLSLEGEWASVRVGGSAVGWVHRDYLVASPVAGTQGGLTLLTPEEMTASFDAARESAIQGLQSNQGYVLGDNCRVRSGPGTTYGILATVNEGDTFVVEGSYEGWLKGAFTGGANGWIAGWLVTTATTPTALSASQIPASPSAPVPYSLSGSSIGEQIAQAALAMQGVPYRYAAASPESGFDCSGLVFYAHKQLGITPPRSSYDMWDAGRPVDRESLLPGDVVCFANTSGPGVSHVGLYIGNGNFVHAPQTGDVVKVQSLASRSMSFCGARRFW
ncbi:MAG: SH3 domain-containing protein [Armatimonadota bacterium]|jgi:cell wall-associated NlpC family hydrolase/SH3-like domain-containing protein